MIDAGVMRVLFTGPIMVLREPTPFKLHYHGRKYPLEPCHEKTCLSHMRTTKVQIRMRIHTFFVRCLDSIVSVGAMDNISRL